MKKPALIWICIVIISCTALVSAQFPIKIPKIPKTPKTEPTKTEKPKTEPSRATSSSEKPSPAIGSATEPSIAKDFVQVTPFTYSSYQKNYDVWSWVPMMSFRINGPVGSGSQLYAEFNVPGTGIVKFDCRTNEREAGNWDDVECGGRDSVPEEKASKYTGLVSFSIKMRNELAGTDQTLFTGKAKIVKAHSNEAQTPKFVNHFVYYVDHDWNLPIGYVFYREDERRGMKSPILNLAFWVRGDPYNFQPHLFYQGKEVGKMTYEGQEVGKASCESEKDNTTTNYVADNVPQKAKWSRIICTFGNVRGWDKTGEAPGMFGPLYSLDKNPGEYEFKLLWNNKLARSIKFNVKPDGSFDNGIATANKINSERTIVPVQIIGDQDGPWDRAAWKADAFYGNPLTGFTALP
jgi:hypothetical protein